MECFEDCNVGSKDDSEVGDLHWFEQAFLFDESMFGDAITCVFDDYRVEDVSESLRIVHNEDAATSKEVEIGLVETIHDD